RNDEDPSRTGDLANHGFNDLVDLGKDLRTGLNTGFQGDIDFGHTALDLVRHRNYRRFRHFGNRQTRRLDFLCAQAVPGHIDDIIDSAENAEIAVGGQHRAVRRKIGPVTPILAVAILAVFGVVLGNETVVRTPNGLHDSRPGIPDADVARLARSSRDLLPVFVND